MNKPKCNFKYLLVVSLLVFFSALCSSCKNREKETPGTDSGSPMPSPNSDSKTTNPESKEQPQAQAPKRIVSLSPNITEILFAVGAGNQVAAVTTFCDYPPQAKALPKIGSFMSPSLEMILKAEPDLVLASGFETHPLVPKFKELGLPLVVISPQSPGEILDAITKIGGMTGHGEQARAVVNSISRRLEKIRAETASSPKYKRLKVFIEIGFPPLYSAGPYTFVSRIVSEAGGINILEGKTSIEWPQVSSETVFTANPDVILLGYMMGSAEDKLNRRTGWDQMTAVRKGWIIGDVDPNLFLRQGPRFIDGIEAIHERLKGFMARADL